MDLKNFFSVWINAVIHPKKTFAEEKSKASIKQALINNTIVFGLLALIYSLPAGQYGLLSITIFFFLFLGLFIATIVPNLIAFGIAKLLGGQGNFSQQLYLNSLYSILWFVLLLALILNSKVPFLFLPVIIYFLYLLILSYKEAHKISFIRSIIVTLSAGISIAIIALIAIFLLIIIGLLIIGGGGIGAGPGALG